MSDPETKTMVVSFLKNLVMKHPYFGCTQLSPIPKAIEKTASFPQPRTRRHFARDPRVRW